MLRKQVNAAVIFLKKYGVTIDRRQSGYIGQMRRFSIRINAGSRWKIISFVSCDARCGGYINEAGRIFADLGNICSGQSILYAIVDKFFSIKTAEPVKGTDP